MSIIVEYDKSDIKKAIDFKEKPKIDYRDILKPEDFTIYSKLREIRKEIAEKNGVPVYTVFTNEQLITVK